jgi:hypothetical protein
MHVPCLRRSLAAAWLLLAVLAVPAAAGDPPPGQASPAAGATAVPAADPDLDINLVQPDFTVSALPTTLRLPRHRMSFRLTHRFNEPLNQSGLGDLFGMDSGAQMGFEFRYGLVRGAQVGVYRTSDQTIQLFTQYDVRQQGKGVPIGIAAYASVEGARNFQADYAPGIGAVISREIGQRAAIYAEPFWMDHTNTEPSSQYPDEATTIIGLGVRVRVLEATYLTAEIAPRVGGFGPGSMHTAFGIEKRAGGHLFQLTIANNQGTTLANVARGGPHGNDWYLGFNLSRKFY